LKKFQFWQAMVPCLTEIRMDKVARSCITFDTIMRHSLQKMSDSYKHTWVMQQESFWFQNHSNSST
jgi:hypothetical protein